MKREILCLDCADNPTSQDLSYRALLQRVVTPPDHTRRVRGRVINEKRCDRCNKTLLPSDQVVCISTWNSGEYFSWELDHVRLEA